MATKAKYQEPLLPQNEARALFRSGAGEIDGFNRARERMSRVLSAPPSKKVMPGADFVALSKETDIQLQSFGKPKMSDLWYTWNVQEDPLAVDGGAEEETLKDEVESVMGEKGALLVRTVIDTAGGNKRRAFTMDYEWVPAGQAPSIELESDGAKFAIEFLCGDLAACESTLLLGEETGDVTTPLVGGDLIPPLPKRTEEDEIGITHGFYLHEDNVKIFWGGVTAPFRVVRLEIKEEDKYPTPGEFLGMAVKAWPNHAWFNQTTNPFIFSANWFETTHYSSGKVEDKNDINGDGTDFDYSVRIRGILETEVKSSDFLEYEIGDRVALIKLSSLDDDTLFTNVEMKANGYSTSWIIVPITFFQE